MQIQVGPALTDEVILPSLTHCGRRHASHGHGEAQQGVVLVLGKGQEFGDTLEGLGCG